MEAENTPIDREELEKKIDIIFEAADLAVHAIMRRIADEVIN